MTSCWLSLPRIRSSPSSSFTQTSSLKLKLQRNGIFQQTAKAERSQRARGIGGHRIFTLVRAVTGRVGFRGVDWRCRGDQEKASPQAENRPRGCPTFAEIAAGKSLSSNLGTESGKS